MRGTRSAIGFTMTLAGLGLGLAVSRPAAAGEGGDAAKPDPLAVGYEIFNREWTPDDPRGHGGDGLGPVYNDTSCVACHNAGGAGGAGAASKNIDVLTASRSSSIRPAGTPVAEAALAAPGEGPADFHAGFKSSRTVVLHKFGSDPNYGSWLTSALGRLGRNESLALLGSTKVVVSEIRGDDLAATPPAVPVGPSDADDARALARMRELRATVLSDSASSRDSMALGAFKVSRSQRNPTALFGLGLIDSIPEQAIREAASRQGMESPEVAGRVSPLKGGRVGRLGWKGQVADVADFVLNACAVELGLEVPGHGQAGSPLAPKYRAAGLDLSADECESLVAYVRSLPRPAERAPSGPAEAAHLDAGKTAFAAVGCATCHAPRLGEVAGLYSDLLLHEMGDDMGDDGSYTDDSEGDDPFDPIVADAAREGLPSELKDRGASRTEWRTPPLWGFRDSGPYLHDGRARNLEEAVAMHGGQGEASARKFFALPPRERLQVEMFLKSLTAPAAVDLARRD